MSGGQLDAESEIPRGLGVVGGWELSRETPAASRALVFESKSLWERAGWGFTTRSGTREAGARPRRLRLSSAKAAE